MAEIPLAPSRLISLGYQYLSRNVLSCNDKLLEQIAFHLESGEQSQGAAYCSLLVNLYEHLYCWPTSASRCKHLIAEAGATVLDYGCGSGFYALNLALSGRRVTCFDTNYTALDFVSWAAKQLRVIIDVQHEPSGIFDTIICINVLDHHEDALDLISKIRRSIRPDGDLFVFAHFSSDGAHASGEIAIERAFNALATYFCRDNQHMDRHAFLERWLHVTSSDKARIQHLVFSGKLLSTTPLTSLTPSLHPSTVAYRDDFGRTVLIGRQFYLPSLRISKCGSTILEMCDGSKSIASILELGGSQGIKRSQILEFIEGLWKRRHLFLSQI